MKNIIEALQWRYATKVFDTNKKLSEEQKSVLLESLRMSASSYGLQPWKFVVVTNPEVRMKLKEAAWGQPQITDSSELIVLCVKKNVDSALVDTWMQSIAKQRGVEVETLKGYADMINGSLAGRTPEAAKEWASRQVYIALGTLLTAAAVLEIDACPMEGFDNKKFDEILGLDAMGVESRVLAAVGFRSPEDKMANLPKARFPKEDVVVEVK